MFFAIKSSYICKPFPNTFPLRVRETKFIEQNQQKWSEYENMLKSGHTDPEKLNDLFVQITDDLSYARTFYPNRSVKVYLNHLAQRIFHHIYKSKKFPGNRVVKFWTEDIPQVMWESRYAMRLSLMLFILSFGIGVLSSIINPDFARIILGDEYVEMTLRNIESGDPMAVYKQSEAFGMTFGIAANNLFVALKTAVFGVIASVGTAFMMIYNGIMVGAFQFFFIERGLFWQSFLTIWIHGTLEISAIIIAGGAGLTAGSGLLFPGTFSRTQAFQLTMRRGLKIFIGVAPVIMLAAFFEGFLTRYTETPDIIRAIFILTSLAFVVGYFIMLPRIKAMRGDFELMAPDTDLPPEKFRPIDFNQIKSAGSIVTDAFTVLKRNKKLTLAAVFGSGLIYTLFGVIEPPRHTIEGPIDFAEVYGLTAFYNLQAFFGEGYTDLNRWLSIGLLMLTTMLSHRMVDNEMDAAARPGWNFATISRYLIVLVPFSLFILVVRIEAGAWVWLLGFGIFPMVAHWMASIRYEQNNPVSGFFSTFFNVLKGAWSWTPGLVGILMCNLMGLFIWFMESELWRILLQFFSWLVPSGEENMHTFVVTISAFVLSTAFHFAWLLLSVAGAMYYFSYREITEANALHEQIDEIGTARQIRGIIRE